MDANHVLERLTVGGRQLVTWQVEECFSQPNVEVCQHMLGWAVEATRGLGGSDLLELYCGNGNFSFALADNFRTVVATEVRR